MSSNVAIKVSGLSKCYHIYEQPRDRLKQSILPRIQQLTQRAVRKYFREFWALNNVSFVVREGETVGIIGRNGSGKSTLLQMICGTLNPSSGGIETSGRIAALLELGSGFNPEFTGRENVYMNAAVLGLSSEEINARFEDILAFAEIGDFIDQPVKTYSSGMFVRLAFAVAVHTQPEILIVDEALSVGDIAFQNKCMRKIQELKLRGTSIMFVSHDLSTIQIMCDRAIWLKDGSLILDGDPVAVCQEYYAATAGGENLDTAIPTLAPQIPQHVTGMASFIRMRVLNREGIESQLFSVGDEIRVDFALRADADLDEIVFAISVYRSDGDWLVGQSSRENNVVWSRTKANEVVEGALLLTPCCFAPGNYLVALAAYSNDLSQCYALTGLSKEFAVRASYPTWGKIVHPVNWIKEPHVQ